jgi:hypothetical protein
MSPRNGWGVLVLPGFLNLWCWRRQGAVETSGINICVSKRSVRNLHTEYRVSYNDEAMGSTDRRTVFRFLERERDFSLLHWLQTILETHQFSSSMGMVGLNPGMKRPTSEANHSPHSSAKNTWISASIHPVCVNYMYRDNLTLSFSCTQRNVGWRNKAF